MKKGTLWALLIVALLGAALAIFLLGKNPADDVASQQEPAVVIPAENKTETKAQSYFTAVDNGEKEEKFNFETDFFSITFDTKGASVSSLMLKNHANADGQFVDIIFKGENDNNAFMLYWANNINSPVDDVFSYKLKADGVEFRKTYKKLDGSTFTLVKTFEFKNGEYLFAVDVDVEGSALDENEYAYTIAYEPQVGPTFTTIKNNNYDYRRFYLGFEKNNGKVKRQSPSITNNKEWYKTTSEYKWISLTSKYFTVIAYPENKDVDYMYHVLRRTDAEVSQCDNIYVSVPSNIASSSRTYFYCGPQLKSYLGSYYNGSDNAWGLRNLNLEDAMESGSFLGWLENVLKFILTLLYKIIPNYGVDIIVLTILIKLALWPLNKKSTQSIAKQSALTEEINAIKAKYPENTQKQNLAMQELYKEYGINPLGGCLPLLIQFPILIAFYGLLNKHFELRGAMFIAGWISDLSVPDTVATLSFNIPLLGNEIHILPVVYTVSMILSMKMSQSSTQNSQQQSSMVLMTYIMPIFFFFVLYSAPSGLLLYWFVQNILSIGQQILTNKQVKTHGVVKLEKKESVKKEPSAILKYQERLKKLEEAQNSNKGKKK